MPVEYRRERAEGVLHEGLALFQRHSKEQEHDKTILLDVDHEKYLLADNIGILRVYTARDAGTLVGYACFMVNFSLRHQTILEAIQDSLYIAPEYRKGKVGIGFLRFIERALKEEGVVVLHQHTHPGTVMDSMMPKMGYTHQHNEWEKRLDLE